MRTLAEVNKDITEAHSTNQDFESVMRPLYEERQAIILHNRNVYEDKQYSVEIDCPVHITHKAKLFINGHRYAGVWECDEEGLSDSCPHFDSKVEVVEDSQDRLARIYVCAKCGVVLEGDPDEDQE